MSRQSPGLFALNAGVVSPLALDRVDLAKLRMAAETQENLLPMIMGACAMRPGLGKIDTTNNNESVIPVPFIYSLNVKGMVMVGYSGVQFMTGDAFLSRAAVATAITNNNFAVDLSGWTTADESGAASTWASGSYLQLLGDGNNYAKTYQNVTVAAPDQNVEHALRVKIARGPVTIKVGAAIDADGYFSETVLEDGEHSIAFTPTGGNFYVQFSCSDAVPRLVQLCSVETVGRVTLDNVWGTQYNLLSYDQSGDIVFVATPNHPQYRIRLYDTAMRSWGIDRYKTSDGPFNLTNQTSTTITPSAVRGTVTLTANRSLFRQTMGGSLIRLTHGGQNAVSSISGANQFTNSIRVTGLSSGSGGANQRNFTVTISGTFVATVKLQRSFGIVGAWNDYKTYTAPATDNINDGLDNQIVYYRLGIDTGGYTSGTAVLNLTYSNSIQKGIVRVLSVTDTTHATAEVISTLGATSATTEWDMGAWSAYSGWPSAVGFHDGRLWWGLNDKIYGSISDAFASYDDTVEGDSAPIVRSIATGPVVSIRWFMSLQRFLVGTTIEEVSIRASQFDQPLTPTQFTARNFSTRGCAAVAPVRVDNNGIFVQRSGTRVMVASFDSQSFDFQSHDATRLNPEICGPGIVQAAVQRQPDTRIWFVLKDGTAAVLTFEPQDEVLAWTPVTTNGLIKAICVLPGTTDDSVYLVVQRIPASGPSYMIVEKMATRAESLPGTVTKCVDSHVVYSGAATTSITGLGHLEGLTVVGWADGLPLATPMLVTGGTITTPVAVSNGAFGLGYDGKFKSAKLAYAAQDGTALGKQKRVSRVALQMNSASWYGVVAGRDFSAMNHLPATLGNGRALSQNESLDTYDYNSFSIDGAWNSDSRICFKVSSPYPATFLGVTFDIITNEPLTYGYRPQPGQPQA
ncbi:MAG: hypothetical protein KGP14_02385 [Betaproteobacteria bacterium]|nr:hypothetical protein [Betaproteobacteria bacterium]